MTSNEQGIVLQVLARLDIARDQYYNATNADNDGSRAIGYALAIEQMEEARKELMSIRVKTE